MNIRIKGRNWWGKRPKNSWTAQDRMYSILRNKDNGVYDMVYKVVQTDDRVEIYKDGELVGECEAYELDYICRILEVEYEEEEI